MKFIELIKEKENESNVFVVLNLDIIHLNH